MKMTRAFIRYGYTPLMILGFNAAAIALISTGQSYWWIVPLTLAAFLISFLAERTLPYEPEWNAGHGDTGKDVVHNIVYEISTLNALLIMPLIAAFNPFGGMWPTDWPIWLQLLFAIVVTDFMMTIIHYYSHRVGWMWKLHQVHHGVHRIYGFNGLVRHPLHHTLDLTIGMLPLLILGLPFDIAVLLGFAVVIQLIVQHTNVDVRLGPLHGLLAVGPVHRLHHVHWDGEGDVNFGLFFTVWDRLLGTYRAEAPRAPRAGDIGVTGMPQFSQSYMTQLLMPFVADPSSSEGAKKANEPRGKALTFQAPAE